MSNISPTSQLNDSSLSQEAPRKRFKKFSVPDSKVQEVAPSAIIEIEHALENTEQNIEDKANKKLQQYLQIDNLK
ncbi:MAG: hypothetical protein RLY27_206 [Pseudomonadota bacterium]|jgi:hypothetical protein